MFVCCCVTRVVMCLIVLLYVGVCVWFVYCVVVCLDVICLLLVASWLFGCSFEWRVS